MSTDGPRRRPEPDHAELDAHRQLLRAWFTRRLRSPQDAEDYVQEVYARVLATPTQNKVENWPGMLRRVASSVLVDRFRRDQVRARHMHVSLDDADEVADHAAASPDAALAYRQQLRLLEAALLDLDPLPRQIFMLARFDGLSHREIGARLGLAPVQVGRQIERAVAHLARRLAR